MIIGYTTGVFDLFHIGHLNLLKNAKAMCDKLVVGVTVDELVSYKGKKALIPFEDRIEIVRSCKYVDAAVPQYNMNKLEACKNLVHQFCLLEMIGIIPKNGILSKKNLKQKILRLFISLIQKAFLLQF